ncbi:MAG: phosphoglucosamine mutase [Deltaproteobacteria bacterium]|nr:phosphoglucosamine mutase [Deltaproteobacteria bacterium]
MRRIFGTDGIRGVANVYPMNSETALLLGRAVAHVFRRGKRRHRVLIGKDTRLSGYMLETAMSSGICSMGVDVLLVGPLPTPGIALLTQAMRADVGVVISASHNPFQDNGIKIFASDGFKLPDETEEQIEQIMLENAIDDMRPTAHAVGKAFRIDDAVGRYVVSLKHVMPKDLTLEGIRIVVDCANGAAYKVAPAVFEELGARVYPLNAKPDGRNINRHCGSLYPEVIAQAVRRRKADLGIALDGDADRVVVVSEKGDLLDGDHLMAICARHMQYQKTLRKKTVVSTVMSNLGLERALERMGIRLLRTVVGDRYVVEAMREGGYNLGGEQSGHLVFLDHSTTGDGIVAALLTLSVMLREGRPLSELAAVMTPVPQVILNQSVDQRRPIQDLPKVQQAISRIEKDCGKEGRVLVRYSGTENKVRIMVEGEDKKQITTWAKEIAEAFGKK